MSLELRKRLAPFILGAILLLAATPPIHAAPVFGTHPASWWAGVEAFGQRLWSALGIDSPRGATRTTGEAGGGMDPNGLTVTAPDPATSGGDAGGGMDPDGIEADAGGGMDPNG